MPTGGSKRVLLGRISGAHGIRGEVLIKSFTAAPEDIAAYGALSDADGTRALVVDVLRVTPRGVIARLSGVSDRNAAEALKGVELHVARERLPPVEEGEFYFADLVGLDAVDAEGREIGKVLAVHNFGAGDLLEIKLSGSAKTELVPFTDTTVPSVDVGAGRVIVILPPTTEVRDQKEA